MQSLDEASAARTLLRQKPMGSTRFQAYPWAKLVAEWAREAPQPYQGQALREVETGLDVVVLPLLLQSAAPHHDSLSAVMYVRTIYGLREECLCYGAFTAAGRETFCFAPGLVRDLRRTDIQQVRLDMLRLPFPAFFLHFGRQEDIQIEDDQRLSPESFDGAFVWQCDDGTLHLSLTFSRPGGSSGLSGPACEIGPDLLGLPADVALRKGLERAAEESIEAQAEMIAPNDASELESQRASYAKAVEGAAALVVNALFYLSAYRNLPDVRPEEATPALLVQKHLGARNAKQQREARGLLQKSGFTVVRLCGEEGGSQGDGERQVASPATLRTHWRRGHWRNQRYGEKLSLEHLVWVRPTLVAAGREAIEERRYDVFEKPGRHTLLGHMVS